MWKATLDKNMVDKIFVKENEKMTQVIKWVEENLDRIERVIMDNNLDFPTYPMESGLVWMEEEGVHFTFEVLDKDEVEIVYYISHPSVMDIPMFKFKTAIAKTFEDIITDVKFQEFNSEDREIFHQALIVADNTVWKTEKKFVGLMLFMLFHEGEVVKVDGSKEEYRNKREVRRYKAKTGKAVPLIKRTYVVGDFNPAKTKVAGAPRNYTIPNREVKYKGHYRHLKSGKVIWIKEGSRYKDKGNKQSKTYKL